MADHDLCTSDVRRKEIYKSASNKVELYIRGSSDFDTLPPLLLEYKGKIRIGGCMPGHAVDNLKETIL